MYRKRRAACHDLALAESHRAGEPGTKKSPRSSIRGTGRLGLAGAGGGIRTRKHISAENFKFSEWASSSTPALYCLSLIISQVFHESKFIFLYFPILNQSAISASTIFRTKWSHRNIFSIRSTRILICIVLFIRRPDEFLSAHRTDHNLILEHDSLFLAMQFSIFRFRQHNQIAQIVVQRVFIDVMDFLVVVQIPAEMYRHQKLRIRYDALHRFDVCPYSPVSLVRFIYRHVIL